MITFLGHSAHLAWLPVAHGSTVARSTGVLKFPVFIGGFAFALSARQRIHSFAKQLIAPPAADLCSYPLIRLTAETLEVPLIRQPSISVHSEVHSEPRQKGCKGDVQALWGLVTSSYINVLLLTAPLGIMSARLGWPPVATFFLVRCFVCCVLCTLLHPVNGSTPAVHGMAWHGRYVVLQTETSSLCSPALP